MKKSAFAALTTSILLACFSLVGFADIRIKQKQDVGGRTITTDVAIKGARERSESEIMEGMKTVTIKECDLKRNITINDNARKYLIEPMITNYEASGPAAAADVPVSSGDRRKGGVVTMTSVITDTGERKQMFGFTARHIKTMMTTEPSPEACQTEKTKFETDGWYIDLNVEFNCDIDNPVSSGGMPQRPGCRDQIRIRRSGGGKLGYPVMVKTTMFDNDGNESFSMTTEVIELTRATLDQSLFEIPAGYTQAQSQQEMYSFGSMAGMMGNQGSGSNAGGRTPDTAAMAASAAAATGSKKPGTIRIGVVGLENRTAESFDGESARQRLIGGLMGSNMDAVPIYSKEPSAVNSEAKQKDCDFVLYTDVTGLKQSQANKIGGMFGRAAGIGDVKPRFETSVEFRLLATGSDSPQFQSKSAAKEDGDATSTVGSAVDREAKMVAAAAKKR